MSAELMDGGPVRRRPNYRLRRNLTEAAALAFSVAVVIWTLIPIYNIVAVALRAPATNWQPLLNSSKNSKA